MALKEMLGWSRNLGLALVAISALATPSVVLACDGKPCGDHGGPCAQDVKTLCPDASTRQEFHQCLHDHADQVSAACTEKMQAWQQRRAAVETACQADLTAFCPDATGRDIRHCLHEHRSELSDSCSQAIDALHQHHCGDKTQG